MLFERKSLNDVIADTPELRARGDWLCLNIETNTSWPTVAQPMQFENRSLWIIPHTTDNHAGLAINRSADFERDEAWALLHRALSLLAWTQDAGAVVTDMSGGDLPRMMGLGGTTGVSTRAGFDLSDLIQVHDDRGRLALALMREARGLNHPAYAFLSFFRALEVAIPDGRARGRWITDNIDDIDKRFKEALAKLREDVPRDIGVHLRESGRHAIAHASAGPIINPDDPRDAKRLRSELPIIHGLAVLAVERCLGIQTSHTIWKEHLYELRGWKQIFGDSLVKALLEGDPPRDGQQVDVPILNVRLRRSAPFSPLERMRPLQAAFQPGKIEVVYRSIDGLIDVIFWLNFEEERLEFDIERSFVARDDGSAGAARNGKELERFFRDYFLNGELQMWDADSGALVSRRDAFIPLNCYVDVDKCDAAIADWDKLIAEREAAAMIGGADELAFTSRDRTF